MPRFNVTTAETAYTRYVVDAPNPEQAKELVANQSTRSKLEEWSEAGYGDDAEVIDVELRQGMGEG